MQKINCERWFYVFLLIHVLVWTLVPTLFRYTLPLDAMEGATWGHQLEWGYDKNPFLNAWLTALAVWIGGKSGWIIYFFSQLSVAIAFWVVFQFGKKILTPLYALVAVFLLEGIQYYNLHAIDFDDNVLELGLWALMAWFFYRALEQQKIRDWILTGIFAALGMLTKYYTAILLLTMLAFLLRNPKNRDSFKLSGIYYGLIFFIVMLTPHIIWLFQHQFITITYVLRRISSNSLWDKHFYFPLQFALYQIEIFCGSLVLFGFLLIGKKPLLAPTRIAFRRDDWLFLFFIGLGPYLLTVVLAIIIGMRLHNGWGQPLLTFWTLILLAFVQPNITAARFYRLIAVLVCAVSIAVISYEISLARAGNTSTANFPGKNIAIALTKQWHELYHTKLFYVVGPRWLAGNIAFYSDDKPAVYIIADPHLSPWIDEKKLRESGAIFVWDSKKFHEELPHDMTKRFQQLEKLQRQNYFWLRDQSIPPVEIGVAFLRPLS